ncbi:MAG: hypothetical protein OEY14_12595 [Myxococcales bacterium]|nr:hypothetical protein [Myxococcales bacterium]
MSTAIEAGWLVESVGVRHLESWGVIRVQGEDARSWLNGQITNDVAEPAPGEAKRALCTTHKGRIIADLWVLDEGRSMLLLVPLEALEGLLSTLERFIVMEDVELTRLGLAVLSAQGPRALETLGDRAGWRVDRLGRGGVDRLVPLASLEGELDALRREAEARGGGLVSAEGWELARIRAGRAAYGRDFDIETYPAEAGLVDEAVSFDKGCYVGQEAVGKLQHRGKAPRRLVHLALDGWAEPGTPLSVEGTRLGELRSCVRDPEAGVIALGYLRRAQAEPGVRVRAGEVEGRVLALLDEPLAARR